MHHTRPMTAALVLLLSLVWGAPTLAATRCTTYEEKSLGRLQTICDDGTRAISTYNKTLSRWESTVTPPDHAEKGRPLTKAPRR